LPQIRSYTVYIHGNFGREIAADAVIYGVYLRYFWQGNCRRYGHIRCISTVLTKPTYKQCCPTCPSSHSSYVSWQPLFKNPVCSLLLYLHAHSHCLASTCPCLSDQHAHSHSLASTCTFSSDLHARSHCLATTCTYVSDLHAHSHCLASTCTSFPDLHAHSHCLASTCTSLS